MRWCGAYALLFINPSSWPSRAATQSITVRHLSPLSLAFFFSFMRVLKKQNQKRKTKTKTWAFLELLSNKK